MSIGAVLARVVMTGNCLSRKANQILNVTLKELQADVKRLLKRFLKKKVLPLQLSHISISVNTTRRGPCGERRRVRKTLIT
jgi:hypothetical protein